MCHGCWCQIGWSVFQKMLIYWDIQTQPSLGITANGPQKRMYPVDGNCVDENVLSSYVRGQMRLDRLIQDDGKAKVT